LKEETAVNLPVRHVSILKIKVTLGSLELVGKPSIFCTLATADSLLFFFFNVRCILGDVAQKGSLPIIRNPVFFQIQLDFSGLGAKFSPDAIGVNLGVVTPIASGLGSVLNVKLTVSILGLPHDLLCNPFTNIFSFQLMTNLISAVFSKYEYLY